VKVPHAGFRHVKICELLFSLQSALVLRPRSRRAMEFILYSGSSFVFTRYTPNMNNNINTLART
jgi:hypothetical protein